MMWTYKSAKPFADKIGGCIVGSVKTKGRSDNDVDILVPEYSQCVGNIIEKMGFTYMGSQTVSPMKFGELENLGEGLNFGLEIEDLKIL